MFDPIAAKVTQGVEQTAGAATPASFAGQGAAQSGVLAFEDAMRTAGAGGAGPAPQVVQAQFVSETAPVQGVDPAQGVTQAQAPAATDQNAQQRALDGLGLDAVAGTGAGAEAGATSGQSILDGLSRIRGAFDTAEARVGAHSNGEMMDVTKIMALQTEVVQYTMLVDVSSKLAGKSTQAVDTLMKGQ